MKSKRAQIVFDADMVKNIEEESASIYLETCSFSAKVQYFVKLGIIKSRENRGIKDKNNVQK